MEAVGFCYTELFTRECAEGVEIGYVQPSVQQLRPMGHTERGDVSNHPFTSEIAHFLDCIRNNEGSYVNLADAAKTHAVCYALERSSAEGRSVKVQETYDEMG